MSGVLDNPVWSALTTSQAHLAVDCGSFLRFPPGISPFCAVRNRESFIDDPRELAGGGYFCGEIPRFSSRCTVIDVAPVLQMVFEGTPAPGAEDGVELLTEQDGPEMLDLVERVLPGFFRAETWRLGRYIGLRQDGRIAAMAGERFWMSGYREVSAVCTHPDYLGRGFGLRMTVLATQWILAQGLTPFLHVGSLNARAQSVYMRAGFVTRAELPIVFVR